MAIDTVNDALDEAIAIKGQIRTAIIGKEVAVPADTPFEDYPGKINQIKGILQTKNITPTAAGGDVTPDSGYDGFSKVTLPAEPNLVAANISDGVSIFGVMGTAQTATFNIGQFFARTLTSLSLGVSAIGDYMFYQNTALQTFTDTSLTDLGSYAFYNCTGLTTFTAGSGLTDLEPYTFYGCTNLATFDMSHIESVGNYAMYNCNRVNNIGRLHASEIGQYGCYSLSSNAANGFVYDPTDPAEIADYGFQYAKITEVTGEIKTVGTYGLANLASVFTTISADFNGAIGNYGLANNQYIKNVDFSDSDITNLGQYAMYYLGWNRANYSTDPYMQLDFRGSSFGTVDQYAFSYIRYADIYLPSSVTQINAYAFQTCQYVNLYMQGAAPVLSSTTAFNNTTGFKIFAPWTHLSSYVNGTNWSSLSNIIGYAPAGSFAAGATLPQYNGEGYEVTWYSDEAKTTQIATCPAGSPMIYCSIGSTKVKQVINISTNGPITVTILDSNNDPVDLSYGFVLCDSGDTFSVSASTLDGYVCSLTIDGTKVTSFPYALTVGSADVAISGMAYDPSAINPDYTTATWREIKNAVDQGVAATIYASYIGTIRNVTLTNGQVCRVRLSNNTTDLYDYASGNGKTGFVLEFVDALNQTYPMNQTGTNAGGWDASYMRNTVMPLFLNLLPSDLKEVLSPVITKSCKSGNDGTIVESEDTAFLPAEREIFASRQYSRTEEWNALTRWQYYAQNDTNAARIKYVNGSANSCFERSPQQDYSYSFCMVGSSGSAGYANAGSNRGVAPAVCI